jgi:hypothetical protein
MYKIPDDFNLTSIKSQTISQIAFGLNYITIFFNKGFIQFSGGFAFELDGHNFNYEEVYPVQNDYGLIKLLLEKQIIDIYTNIEKNNLYMKLDNGNLLLLFGSEQYESFIVNIDGKQIIV